MRELWTGGRTKSIKISVMFARVSLLISPVSLAIALGFFASVGLAEPRVGGTEPKAPIAIQGLLKEYCDRCHGPEEQKGDLRLDEFTTTAHVIQNRKIWLDVLEQLESREMPSKKPFPSEAEYEEMIAWVDGVVNHIDWDEIKHPGHVTIPRLTKLEYQRTVSDLLGLDISAGRDFSEDGEGKSGFTNDRDGLFITPSQMEKYFDSAERAIESVMALNAKPVKLHFESEDMFMTESGSRAQPFLDEGVGYILTRGQMTLYDSVEIPYDGLYRFIVRARSTTNGVTGGKLRLNDVESGEFEVPGAAPGNFEIVTFVPKGTHQMAWNIKAFNRRGPQTRLKNPAAYPQPPEDAPQIITAQSKIRAPKFPRKGDEVAPLLGLINQYDAAQSGVQRAYEWLRIHGPDGDPRQLERFRNYVLDRMKSVDELRPKIAGLLGITEEELEKRFASANQESLADRMRLFNMAASKIVVQTGSLSINWIEVNGPLGGENGRAAELAALFREAAPAATNRGQLIEELTGFIRRAFRRPVSEQEVAAFHAIYEGAKERGDDHAEALRQTLAAVMISPKFLFREEQRGTGVAFSENARDGSDGAAFDLDDWELASRLSYFVWLSMPDDELFSLAEEGKLRDADVLVAQVDRMLGDPRADVFLSSFAGQWLGYESLGVSVFPDEARFPQFSPELAQAMKDETQLWFGEVFRADRPLMDLIDARETFLNRDLARHYAISGVKSPTMERVVLKDPKRGGLLGMASVLTATSTPVRTSPVIRGAWVLERILGEDPGEPLPSAGQLPGNAGEERGKTLREELAIHSDRAECAVCHDKIDPPGFSLEQFDAIGRFREKEAGKPVDATGKMPDGTELNGVVELKRYLIEHRGEDIARNITERLLMFALGRELKFFDEPSVQTILESAAADGYRARAVVKQIVLSYPFLHQHPNPELSFETP